MLPNGPMDHVELSRIRAISEKVLALQKQGKSVLELQIGEPDFVTPAHIVDAAKRSMAEGLTHYAPNRGVLALRKEIAQKLKRENRIDPNPETEIMVTSGCTEALFCSIVGLLNPDDEMIVIEPAYVSYLQLARIVRAKTVPVHAIEERGWLPDIEEIKRAITPKTRMLIVNSPCNPTGAVYPECLLKEIAGLAIKHNLIVLADEVYERLIYEGEKHVSIASMPGMENRTITINGFSKAYAMTGWRIGYLTVCKELLLPILKVHQYAVACSNTMSEHAAIEALRNGEPHVRKMISEYSKRRSFLVSALREIEGISCVPPSGAFYLYPNVSGVGLSGSAFAAALLEEGFVASVPGPAFDSFCDKNVRISFASSMENLEEFIRRLRSFLKR